MKPGYTLPPAMARTMQQRLPATLQLTVPSLPSANKRLLDVLPLEDMPALLAARLPSDLAQCSLPALPGAQVNALAGAAPYAAALAACRTAPFPDDRSFVFGALPAK